MITTLRGWLLFLLFVVLPLGQAAEFTVVIVQEADHTCKVLQGPNPDLDVLIPQNWTKLDITKEQCEVALVQIKKNDHLDNNIRNYLDLLSCSKESNLRSLSYFGPGAKELCAAAGYDFAKERLLVGVTPPTLAKEKISSSWIIVLFLAIIILVLLIFIKKRRTRSN